MTLNTTALVHEAFLKLSDQSTYDWESRSHFFAIVAKTIRAVLNANPDVELFASLKLQGANTFPDWVSQPSNDWPAETGGIFGNTVDRPNPEHYSTMVADYLSFLRDEGIATRPDDAHDADRREVLVRLGLARPPVRVEQTIDGKPHMTMDLVENGQK